MIMALPLNFLKIDISVRNIASQVSDSKNELISLCSAFLKMYQ